MRMGRMAKSRPFLLYVVVVSILTAIYFFLIATPIYVSESSFTVRGRPAAASAGAASGAGSLISAVTGGGGGGSAADSLVGARRNRRFHQLAANHEGAR